MSPVGVVPKKASGEFRIIHNLLYPEGTSVNDKISFSACSVSYASIEDAIHLVKTSGVGSYMEKTDIKSFGLSPFAHRTTAFSVSNGIVSSILISASPWSVHLRAKSLRHSVQLFSGWHTINKGCNI